jgi:hypothetical protein
VDSHRKLSSNGVFAVISNPTHTSKYVFVFGVLSVLSILITLGGNFTGCANAATCGIGDARILGSGLVANEDGNAVDTRFEGDTDAYTFNLDSATDSVQIGQQGPDASEKFLVNGAATFKSGTTTIATAAISAGTITGITDLALADGGTGASTAAAARANLDVDQAGTDNSTDVTLAGTPDYITVAGQVITRGLVDLTTDVTGDLPVAEGGTGSSTAPGARTNLGLGSLATASAINNGNWSGTDLSVANGGTGASSLTDHYVLVGSGTGAVTPVSPSTSGYVLTSNGTGADPTFQEPASGGGGLVEADTWRLHTSFSGAATPISTNLERVDTDGFGKLGTGMSHSSGVFTFPETGVWLIIYGLGYLGESGPEDRAFGFIQTTTNNSSYSDAARLSNNDYSSGDSYMTTEGHFIFDVTNTTTHKVRFTVSAANGRTHGDSYQNATYFSFIKLGDT